MCLATCRFYDTALPCAIGAGRARRGTSERRGERGDAEAPPRRFDLIRPLHLRRGGVSAQIRLLGINNQAACAGHRGSLGGKHSQSAADPCIDRVLVANVQLSPRQKFTTEQHRIAIEFAASTGMRTSSTRTRIRARFPTIETSPLER